MINSPAITMAIGVRNLIVVPGAAARSSPRRELLPTGSSNEYKTPRLDTVLVSYPGKPKVRIIGRQKPDVRRKLLGLFRQRRKPGIKQKIVPILTGL